MSNGVLDMSIFGFGDKLTSTGLEEPMKVPDLPIDRAALRAKVDNLALSLRNCYNSFAGVQADSFIFAKDTLAKTIDQLEKGRLYPSGAWLECAEAKLVCMSVARSPQEKAKVEFLWDGIIETCKRHI